MLQKMSAILFRLQYANIRMKAQFRWKKNISVVWFIWFPTNKIRRLFQGLFKGQIHTFQVLSKLESFRAPWVHRHDVCPTCGIIPAGGSSCQSVLTLTRWKENGEIKSGLEVSEICSWQDYGPFLGPLVIFFIFSRSFSSTFPGKYIIFKTEY